MTLQIRPARAEDAALLAYWAQAMALETENKVLPDAEVLPGIARSTYQALGMQDAHYRIYQQDTRPIGDSAE
jgi:hypothetical protein